MCAVPPFPTRSPILIYLLRQEHPEGCMDLRFWGGCWNVQTRIPIRNQRPSAVGICQWVSTHRGHQGLPWLKTAAFPRACLLAGWPHTATAIKIQPFCPILGRFFWNSSENPLRLLLILYHFSMSVWSCSLLSLFFPWCWSLPNELFFFLFPHTSLHNLRPDHAQNSIPQIPFSQTYIFSPSHEHTTFQILS